MVNRIPETMFIPLEWDLTEEEKEQIKNAELETSVRIENQPTPVAIDLDDNTVGLVAFSTRNKIEKEYGIREYVQQECDITDCQAHLTAVSMVSHKKSLLVLDDEVVPDDENNDSFYREVDEMIAETEQSLADDSESEDEYYCPKCNAVLNEQEGFSPDLSSWVCKNCGQQLTGDNLNNDVYEDVVWYCDKCGAILNDQEGFTEVNKTWKCEKCGYLNDVTEDNIKDEGSFS